MSEFEPPQAVGQHSYRPWLFRRAHSLQSGLSPSPSRRFLPVMLLPVLQLVLL